MSQENFRQQSKDNWYNINSPKEPRDHQLIIGCLQRIADAAEKQIRQIDDLLVSRNKFESDYNEAMATIKKLRAKIKRLENPLGVN